MNKYEVFHARVLLLTKFSINSAVMALEEQRAYIKIRTLLGATLTDIKADLDIVYGSQAASYITITKGSYDLSRVGSPLKMTPIQDIPCQHSVKMTSLLSNVCQMKTLVIQWMRFLSHFEH